MQRPCSFYEISPQEIMVVVFNILDRIFLLWNTTTMILCRLVS